MPSSLARSRVETWTDLTGWETVASMHVARERALSRFYRRGQAARHTKRDIAVSENAPAPPRPARSENRSWTAARDYSDIIISARAGRTIAVHFVDDRPDHVLPV